MRKTKTCEWKTPICVYLDSAALLVGLHLWAEALLRKAAVPSVGPDGCWDTRSQNILCSAAPTEGVSPPRQSRIPTEGSLSLGDAFNNAVGLGFFPRCPCFFRPRHRYFTIPRRRSASVSEITACSHTNIEELDHQNSQILKSQTQLWHVPAEVTKSSRKCRKCIKNLGNRNWNTLLAEHIK